MDMKPLGKTGVDIPEVGYGTWKHRGDPEPIRRALEVGSFLIDTAEAYRTEHYVAEAIKGNRDAYFIATKVSPSHFRYKDVLSAADRSLKELGIDTIDLYQLHWPSDSVPLDETMRAMDELVSVGKVRYVGVSNFSVKLMREAESALGHGRIVSNQIKFSLFDHDFADEVVEYCEELGVTVLAYSPLEQGAFESRMRQQKELASTMERITSEIGKTPAQVMLNWVLRSPVTVVIPKTNHVERVDENAGASGWRLTDEQHAALTEAAGSGGRRRWWIR